MYPKQLHTRQYTVATITTMATAALVAWCGSGLAHAGTDHADNNHEREACALMDDYPGMLRTGAFDIVAYAFAVLSTEMPPTDAAHVIAAATHDDCPNHAAALPYGWS